MRTIEDVILEHVELYRTREIGSTRDAIIKLGLPDEHKFNGAGNFYLSALSMIDKLMKRIENEIRDH
jgi:hypothetical protein